MTAVLVEICNFDVTGSGTAWPNHRLLASRAKRSLRTICRATKALETAGVTTQAVRKTFGPDGKRRRTSNLVRVDPVIAARHAHQPPDLEVVYDNDGTGIAQQLETSKNHAKTRDSGRRENRLSPALWHSRRTITFSTKPPLPPTWPNTGSFDRFSVEDQLHIQENHPPKRPRRPRRRQTHNRRPRQTRRVDTRPETAGKIVVRDAERLTGRQITPASRNRLADLADRLLDHGRYTYSEIQHALSRAPDTLRHPATAWEHRLHLDNINHWTQQTPTADQPIGAATYNGATFLPGTGWITPPLDPCHAQHLNTEGLTLATGETYIPGIGWTHPTPEPETATP